MLSRQVSWLAGQCCCPAFPKTFSGLSDFVGQRLAAYSCGGSSGFGFSAAPASLLASEKRFPKNHDGSDLSTSVHCSQRIIFLCGIPCGTMVWTME